MSDLGDWVNEIRGCVASLGSEPGLGVDQPISEALRRKVTLEGFPGVLPLWKGRRHVVGLKVDPRNSPRNWPAVLIKDRQGLTLATDASTLLPQLIVLRVLSNSPDSARQLTERWPAIESKALTLHRALGGAAESLEAVVTAARDPSVRESFKYIKGKVSQFEQAHSKLLRQIDQSEPFTRYSDWVDACIAAQWRTPDDPAQYGAWGRRVICWAQRLAFSQPTMPKLPAERLYEIIEEDAGIDSGVPIEVSWSVQPGSASAETSLLEAADAIGDNVPKDPVSAGILQALVTEDTNYSGYAHAEAVVALDEHSEPERAWRVMQSAAWWIARTTRELPEAVTKGAQFLAKRHGWVDAQWVLECAK